jgi:hypothetical protein
VANNDKSFKEVFTDAGLPIDFKTGHHGSGDAFKNSKGNDKTSIGFLSREAKVEEPTNSI